MNIFEPNMFIPCCGEHGAVCTCNQTERVLRAYASGNHVVPMDNRERQWCLSKAGNAIPDSYPQEIATKLNDQELASLVLKVIDH
jgi:hypothetical protein